MLLHNDVKVNHEYSVLEVGGDKQGIANAYNWCLDTFGTPGQRWFFYSNKFYFRDEKDYFWFEMRW